MKKEGVKKTLVRNASVLKRFIAFIADLLIINSIILFPFRNTINKILPNKDSFSETFNYLSSSFTTSLTIMMFAISLLSILYFVILEKKLGQTPGKMFFNLYVNSQGKDLKNWQLIVRSMFMIPMFPFILLWFIDPIVMFFNKDNQRLSEILSKTKVVEGYKI